MNTNQRILGSILGIAFMLASAAAVFSHQSSGNIVFRQEAFDQEPGTAPRPPRRDDAVYFISSEMGFDGKPVKGAPYGAEAVTETTQMLADGNRIVKKSTARLYRDSEGRTRREHTLRSIGPFTTEGEPPQTIFISDPVAQVSYMLDVRSRTARKMPLIRFELRVPSAADGTKKVNSKEATTSPAQRERSESFGGSLVMTTTRPIADGGFQVEYSDGENQTRTESLGKQTIEGVEAEGTRSTITIPPGKIGNVLAIDIVNERWYSSELQTIVLARMSDLRFGETIYRLTNIDRSEPDKSLFEVPPDYIVKSVETARSVSGSEDNSIGSASTTSSTAGAISGGVLNGKALTLPVPEYPAIAREANASGSVTVQVTIDEGGNVISAKAVAGDPLLQAAAVAAARRAKFRPTKVSGQAVKVQGTLIYTFSVVK